MTTGPTGWEGWPRIDPQVRRPAINVKPTRGGVSWKEALMARVIRVCTIGPFRSRLATEGADCGDQT